MHITTNLASVPADSQQQQQQSNGKSSGDRNNNNGSSSLSSIEMLGRVKKEELVRLILQTLNDLNYHDAASALQKESGVALESETVTLFRQAILTGDWQLAESFLGSLPMENATDLLRVKFLIRQQKFLELLEEQKTMKALQVLRNELTPLGQNIERLHQLSSLIFCSSVEDIKTQAQWDGAGGSSRQQLLVELQRYISPSTMIPNERLLTLINQAYEWQRRGCLYHTNSNAEFSLFADHVCDKSRFPSTTIRILEGHTDEVWHLSFSNNGRYLASVSKDKTCVIWDMTTFEKIQVLSGQLENASYCAWSPDDTKLLVCGVDASLRLWDPMSGDLLHTYTEHKDQVTSCAWLPDGEHFISGACDKSLCLWNIDGRIQCRWSAQRVLDMKITASGQRVVTMSYERFINIYDLDHFKLLEVGKISEPETITSLSVSADGRYALVNVQESQELHLWDLEEQQLVRKYTGQKQGTFVIRSTFGGDDDAFVLSGSEDNCVYVWSREHQNLLEVLEGHTGIVNCVSWSPTNPAMFASASDDMTIRIWGIPNDAAENMTKDTPDAEDDAKGKIRV